MIPSVSEERNEAKEFYELTRDGEQPLYEGCTRYSRLSFLLKLYDIKCLCGLSDKSLTMILELLKDAFEFASIPSSFYEAKKTITKLGMNYVKIPACPNDCMLFRVKMKRGRPVKFVTLQNGNQGKRIVLSIIRKKFQQKFFVIFH